MMKELVCMVAVVIEAQASPYNRGLLQQRLAVSGCRRPQAAVRLPEQFLRPLRGGGREENKVLQITTCASVQPPQEETLNGSWCQPSLPASANKEELWLEMGQSSKLILRASEML